jgi:hypothetical protein
MPLSDLPDAVVLDYPRLRAALQQVLLPQQVPATSAPLCEPEAADESEALLQDARIPTLWRVWLHAELGLRPLALLRALNPAPELLRELVLRPGPGERVLLEVVVERDRADWLAWLLARLGPELLLHEARTRVGLALPALAAQTQRASRVLCYLVARRLITVRAANDICAGHPGAGAALRRAAWLVRATPVLLAHRLRPGHMLFRLPEQCLRLILAAARPLPSEPFLL